MSVTPPLAGLGDLRRMIKDLDAVMLVTGAAGGRLHGRPMMVQDPDELGGCDLWLVAHEQSAMIEDMRRTHEVCLCGTRPGGAGFFSVTATARLERDRPLIEKLWRPAWQKYFPTGVGDPSITLIELTVQRASTWGTSGEEQVIYERAKRAA
jgi:general stress protein 26